MNTKMKYGLHQPACNLRTADSEVTRPTDRRGSNNVRSGVFGAKHVARHVNELVPDGSQATCVGAPRGLAREVGRNDIIDDDGATEGVDIVDARAGYGDDGSDGDGNSLSHFASGVGLGGEHNVSNADLGSGNDSREAAALTCVVLMFSNRVKQPQPYTTKLCECRISTCSLALAVYK